MPSSWEELPVPVTMQQKMSYLAACQEHFWQMDESDPPAGPGRVIPVPAAVPSPVGSWLRSPGGSAVIGASHTGACAGCGALLTGAEACLRPLCPFAHTFSLCCAACSTAGGAGGAGGGTA